MALLIMGIILLLMVPVAAPAAFVLIIVVVTFDARHLLASDTTKIDLTALGN
jgi:hypothetical protein